VKDVEKHLRQVENTAWSTIDQSAIWRSVWGIMLSNNPVWGTAGAVLNSELVDIEERRFL
jgi:hypothetical protein